MRSTHKNGENFVPDSPLMGECHSHRGHNLIIGITGYAYNNNNNNNSAAKDVTANMVDAGIPVTLEDVKKYVKQKFIEVWQNHWNEYDGQLRRIKPSIEKWFYPKELSRREQVTLCKTRSGHTNLTSGLRNL
ncbi:hypothetical protein JTB14_013485 [Gonioctena quinquepunctata]|nr:hypothetical protein JTB14_013485 [Gonioctena quinquepunctata]